MDEQQLAAAAEYGAAILRVDTERTLAKLAGWEIKTHLFDFDWWGVAIDNGKDGADRRRHAVRTPCQTETEAIEYALPALKEWAAENA